MAGGRFDKLVGKTRPGTYINFESGREQAVISAGTRGTVIIPLPKASYGPAKKFIKLTNASPDAEAATFGYSIYDDDPNRQMLLIREAFKRATTVYAYILTEGEKATAEIEMALPEQEATEISTAVSEAITENMGAKENLTGCTLNFDDGSRKLTMTLTGPVSEVKNTGLFDTVRAARKGLHRHHRRRGHHGGGGLPDDRHLQEAGRLEQGGADVEFAVTVSKDGTEEVYTACVSYPESGASMRAGGGATNTLTAVAKHGGSRGNLLTITVDANPLGGYDVLIHLDGNKVTEYEA